MQYCSNCCLLCEDRCPLCGRKKLREPLENDPVYLISKNAMWAGAVEDLLQSSHIPYEKRGVLGCGITLRTGVGMETYNFFVPYGAYKRSLKLMEELPCENSGSDTEENSANGPEK